MKRALSRSQAHELLRAASVPATRLAHRLNDGDVQSAIVSVLADIRITTPAFCCDAQPKETPMPTRNYEIFETRTGRRIEEDDDDVLQPRPDSTRAVAHARWCVADAARGHGGQGGPPLRPRRRFALHKNGSRYCVDEAARARVEQARAEWIAEMCDAWKTPAAGAVEFRGAQEGDQCTVREGGVGEGGPGHLRMVGGRLVCVPDQRHDSLPRTMTAADAQPIRDAAYRQYCDDLMNAWKAR